MNTKTSTIVGGVAVAAAVVLGVILSLKNFDAEKTECVDIDSARTQLQSLYDSGVTARVQMFTEEKAAIDERLSRCLNAEPVDPYAAAQKTRDAAVAGFNGIPSPADSTSHAEFTAYFQKSDNAYAT